MITKSTAVGFEKLLTKDPLDDYEDLNKYNSKYLPQIERYRKKLQDSVLPEYSITLPEPVEKLEQQQFNAVKYLYDKKLLTPEEFKITDMNSPDLLAKIASKEYSSVEVFKAFAKRATIAHQLTNCAMEIFINEGLERAEYLDKYLNEKGNTIGPLHGLPLSLKEHYHYKGKICHASFASLIDYVAEDHGVSTKILEKLGAIFYIRTNQPQCLMHLDSNNNITGMTRNPYNLSLSPGGSSSGEGALVAFGGSVAGLGSDIGGSIRSPAAFSGCYGLRPSVKRISLAGCNASLAGAEGILCVCGPLGRTIEDIELWMKHYINDGKPWLLDHDVSMMPWRDVPTPKPTDLTIAVMYDDGLVRTTPPISRALKETVSKLEKAGVKIVEFKPLRTQLAYETINNLYNADGNASAKKYLKESGEPLTKLTKWYLNFGQGSTPFTVSETYHLNTLRDSLRQEYNQFLIQNNIDFILSPPYNNVAPKPEEIYNWSYTTLFNILDLPTLVFQTGMFQDPAIDKWDDSFKDYEFRSELEELELSAYDPEEFKGAPIGLQLSGKRYHDEEVVAAGKTINSILH